MGLKILHSADWHLDAPFSSFREEHRRFLKQAQQQIPEKILKICGEEGCQLVLLAGDLFDGPWSRDTLDHVRECLSACNCPVMIAPGNHDPWGANCPWVESWPENIHVFTPELQSLSLKNLDCRVYGAGFSQMDCESLLEGFRAWGEETYQIGVFHGDPTSISSQYNPVTSAQIRKSGLSYLALGHIHQAGGLEVENTVCGWPGCPMGRGWDETGEKGCLLAQLGEETIVQPVNMELPGFYQETIQAEEGISEALHQRLPAMGSENFYRIILEGYGKPDISALYDELSRFPNLEILDRTLDPEKLWDQAGQDSLRGCYFQKLKEAAQEADPELQKKIMLAAEISQKLLAGREVLLP